MGKNGLGFVFGQTNTEVLEEFCATIKQVAHESKATRIVLGGYSMGGLGAFQLGGYKPAMFDVVFAIGGHGQGTLCKSSEGYNCPQPAGEVEFLKFLEKTCPGLAEIPLVYVIHAENDQVSYYDDMKALVEKVQYLGG